MKPVMLFWLNLMLFVAAGCAVGPNYKKPLTGGPHDWDGLSPTASPQIQSVIVSGPAKFSIWWKIFNDDMLTSLIERALTSNLDLKLAEQKIRQSRSALTASFAGLLPAIGSAGSYSREFRGQPEVRDSKKSGNTGGSTQTSTTPERQNLFLIGLDASWEIDLFGGVRRSIEAAGADLRAAEEDRNDVMVSLIAEVGTTYITLRGYQEQITVAKKNLEAQRRTANITEKRFKAGFVSGLDVANAKALAASTEAQIPLLESGARQAIYSLSVLLDQEPAALAKELDQQLPIPSIPSEVPVGLPSDLLRRRPDIRRAEAQLRAATARIGVNVAELFPKFSLASVFDLSSNNWHSLGTKASRFWSWGPAYTWPVFEGGRLWANVNIQKALTEQAATTYEKTVLTALKDVETALVAFSKEQQHYASLSEAVANGRKAEDIAMRQYTAGRKDYLNVLVAQRALYAYEDAWVQSSSAMAVALIALYKALGGGWEEEANYE